MGKKYFALFIIKVIFAYVGLFTVIILNMIFPTKTYKSSAFQYWTIKEYLEILNETFIKDIEFDENFDCKDIFCEY